MAAGNKPIDIWQNVKKGNSNECWEYQGNIMRKGYGRFCMNGRQYLAHRVMYELCFGDVPSGLYVMHKCNNRRCCNPKHLIAGTPRQNALHASASAAPTSSTGIRGVFFDKKSKKWFVRVSDKGRNKDLYRGFSKSEAISARRGWERQMYSFMEGEGYAT